MFPKLGTPAFVTEARMTSRPRPFFMDILICLVVMLIGSVVGGMIQTPVLYAVMFTDPEFYTMVSEGTIDANALTAYVEKMNSHPAVIISSLFATVGTIAAVLIYCRFVEKRRLTSLGMTKKGFFAEYALGLGAGLVLFALSLALPLAFGNITYLGLAQNRNVGLIVLCLFGYIVQGLSEELLCRGFLMVSLSRGASLPVAIIASAIVFAGLHGANPAIGILPMVNLFLFGVLMSLIMIRRGSIWLCAALHTIWNFAEGVLTDFPVSGMKMPTSLFAFSVSETGTAVSGGAFGPEGGIGVTFALCMAIVFTLMCRSENQSDATAAM